MATKCFKPKHAGPRPTNTEYKILQVSIIKGITHTHITTSLNASLTVGWLRDGDVVGFGWFSFSYSAYSVVWRVLRCLIMLVVLKCRCLLPPRGISSRHTLQTANFTSLSDTLKNFQTGELMLPLVSSALLLFTCAPCMHV